MVLVPAAINLFGCSRLLEDVHDRVRDQYREINYLTAVYKQLSVSCERARKECYAVMYDIRRMEALRQVIVLDIEEALDEHRRMCHACLQQLFELNGTIQRGYQSHDGQSHVSVKPYPFALCSRMRACE